jgi:translin
MNLETAEKDLTSLQEKRNALLTKRRAVIVDCAKGIRCVHKHEMGEAKKKLAEAKEKLGYLEKTVKKNPSMSYLLTLCYQETVELEVLVHVIEKKELPELDVPPDAYLLGVLDALGELKRRAMDLLMQGKYDEAMDLYEKMEEIYYSMEGYSFPNSIVEGFKHKQDVMKRVLERLHETLTTAKIHSRN